MLDLYKKCLILGANGFVGRALTCKMLKHFEQVVTFSLDVSEEITLDGVTNIIGDFFDESALEKSLCGCDVVVHLITTMTPVTSNSNPLKDVEQNLLGSIKLLELCRTSGVKKIIFLSSGGTVYGNLDHTEKASENHITEPTCSYGIVKLSIEKYLNLYRTIHGINSISLRVSNPYGPLQECKNSQGVIASFISNAVNNEKLQIWGDGSAVRDFIYIEDLVSAIIAAIKYDGDKSIFNIGSGDGVDLNEILSEIQYILNRKLYVDYIDCDKVGVSRSVLDNSLAISELDWKPRFSLSDGLKKTVDYWVERNN